MTVDVDVVTEQAVRCIVENVTSAQGLASAIRAQAIADVVNVVPTWRCVVVTLAADADAQRVAALIRDLRPDVMTRDAAAQHMLPTRYDGDDLARIADRAGLTVAETVRGHSEAEYVVAFLGFAPGFAYLSGLDPTLATPRLDTPRRRVEAGAVGIAAEVTGIYPAALPGGWNIVGHVDAQLFDASATRPALLLPGDTVRFSPR